MSMFDNPRLFVWLPGVGGRLEAQKWSDLYRDYKGRMDNVLAFHPLSLVEAEMTIDMLAQRYPAPK